MVGERAGFGERVAEASSLRHVLAVEGRPRRIAGHGVCGVVVVRPCTASTNRCDRSDARGPSASALWRSRAHRGTSLARRWRAARSSVRGRRVLRSPASGLQHFVGHVREAGLGKAVPQPTQLPRVPSAELVGDADERDPFCRPSPCGKSGRSMIRMTSIGSPDFAPLKWQHGCRPTSLMGEVPGGNDAARESCPTGPPRAPPRPFR